MKYYILGLDNTLIKRYDRFSFACSKGVTFDDKERTLSGTAQTLAG